MEQTRRQDRIVKENSHRTNPCGTPVEHQSNLPLFVGVFRRFLTNLAFLTPQVVVKPATICSHTTRLRVGRLMRWKSSRVPKDAGNFALFTLAFWLTFLPHDFERADDAIGQTGQGRVARTRETDHPREERLFTRHGRCARKKF